MSESSAPISIPSPVPEQVPDKMAAVRQAEKRKAQEDRDTTRPETKSIQPRRFYEQQARSRHETEGRRE